MPQARAVAALVLAVVLAAPLPARADSLDAAEPWLVVGANTLPTAAFIWSVKTRSRTAAATEIVAGASVGALDVYLASQLYAQGDCASLCRAPAHLLVGIAILDGVVVAHGVYSLVRPPPVLQVGSLRGVVTPTLVTDGRTYGAGLGLGGSF